VAIQDLDETLKQYYSVDDGVLVAEVFPGDPAEKAGIRAKDIIISVNGAPVSSSRELSKRIADIPEGGTAELEISRDGKIKKIKVKVAKREDVKVAAQPGERAEPSFDTIGLQVTDINPNIAEQLQIKDTEGAVVMGVTSGSAAEQAGFATGDLIREINRKPVKNVKDYQTAIDKAKKGDALEFLVKRAFKGYLVIKLTK
jgi:serine protease Do